MGSAHRTFLYTIIWCHMYVVFNRIISLCVIVMSKYTVYPRFSLRNAWGKKLRLFPRRFLMEKKTSAYSLYTYWKTFPIFLNSISVWGDTNDVEFMILCIHHVHIGVSSQASAARSERGIVVCARGSKKASLDIVTCWCHRDKLKAIWFEFGSMPIGLTEEMRCETSYKESEY